MCSISMTPTARGMACPHRKRCGLSSQEEVWSVLTGRGVCGPPQEEAWPVLTGRGEGGPPQEEVCPP